MASGRGGGLARFWPWFAVLVVELLLVVAVVGALQARHDQGVLHSSSSLGATAQVTRTERHCKGGGDCAYDSYGRYTVAGHDETGVLLRCCASHPLSGAVAVKVAPHDLRHPVLAIAASQGAVVLGVAAAVVLVVGNAALVVLLRRRRRTP